jgi:hypothetical protein
MSILDFFKKKEPEFEDVKFKDYRDYYGHFHMFYPKDWKYDPPVVVDKGGYAVVFHSDKTNSQLRVGVETILPLRFDFGRYAKDEIEKSSAGIVSKAHKSKFGKYVCFRTDYEYESEGKEFIGAKILFYTGDRVFSVFYTYPKEERKNIEKILKYMAESIVVHPAKTKIFKSPRP